jgi:hypothetical protein
MSTVAPLTGGPAGPPGSVAPTDEAGLRPDPRDAVASRPAAVRLDAVT